MRNLLLLSLLFQASVLAREVGDVPDRDLDKMVARVESRSFTYYGFGPAGIGGDAGSGPDYQFVYGRVFEPSPQAALKILGTYTHGKQRQLLEISLGVNGYLSAKDAGPFATADLGLGVSRLQEPSRFGRGFTAGIGAGVTLFRTSSTPLEISLRLSRLLVGDDEGAVTAGALRLAVLL